MPKRFKSAINILYNDEVVSSECIVSMEDLFRGDIKILSLSPQTFHKSSPNHLNGSVTELMTFADVSQNRLCPLPIHYIVIRYPQRMVQMALCDLSHAYHKQVTNVSPACFCHPTVGNFDVSPYVNGIEQYNKKKFLEQLLHDSLDIMFIFLHVT